MNFANMYSENSFCPMCERRLDTQEHSALCPVLQSILSLVKQIEYSHKHGSVKQQKEYFQIYKRYLELRDDLIDSSEGFSLPGLHTCPMRPQTARHGEATESGNTSGSLPQPA